MRFNGALEVAYTVVRSGGVVCRRAKLLLVVHTAEVMITTAVTMSNLVSFIAFSPIYGSVPSLVHESREAPRNLVSGTRGWLDKYIASGYIGWWSERFAVGKETRYRR